LPSERATREIVGPFPVAVRDSGQRSAERVASCGIPPDRVWVVCVPGSEDTWADPPATLVDDGAVVVHERPSMEGPHPLATERSKVSVPVVAAVAAGATARLVTTSAVAAQAETRPRARVRGSAVRLMGSAFGVARTGRSRFM